MLFRATAALLILLPTVVTPARAQEADGARTVATGSVAGSVIDRATRQPIADAQVAVVGMTLVVVTGSDGRFRIPAVPIGTQRLRVSRLGFSPALQTDLLINPGRPTQTAIALDAVAVSLGSVQVDGGATSLQAPPSMPNSRIALSYEEIRRSPGAVGDVSRLVQALPGVLTGNDTRNDIVARGGSPTENLILVDGIEVPNLNHFAGQATTGGPIGMLNNELVRDATFMNGGFGPRYGNRLSSVLDISLREGNADRYRTEFDMSTAGAGLIVEGPIGNRATMIFSGRQSFLNLIAPALGLTAVPYTTNFQFKTAFHRDARNELAIVGIGGFDRIDFTSTTDKTDDPDPPGSTRVRGSRWVGGASWQRLVGSTGVGTFLVSASTAASSVRVREDAFGPTPVFFNDARESEYTARYDLQLSLPRIAGVSTGVSAKRMTIRSELASPFGVENPFSPAPARVDATDIDLSEDATIAAGYLELARTVGRVDLTASARVDHFSLASTTRVGPRVSARVPLTDDLALSGTWGRYHQQAPLVYVANVAENRALAPMRADQGVVSLRWTPRPDLLLSIEGFDKQYADYPVARDYPQLSLANTGDQIGLQGFIFPLLAEGTGRSRGVELFAQRKLTGSTYGQVSYTRSRVEHRARDGVWRRGGYDSPDLLTALLGAKRGSKWEFSTRASFSTGRPITSLLATASATQNRLVFDVARLNSERAPDYMRLDVRVDRRFLLRGSWLATYFEIQNVTNRENRSVEQWNTKTRAVEWREQVALLPLVGINWKF